MNIPTNIVRRGLVGGFACPVSGVEFVAADPSRDQKADLYRQAQAHTAALVFDMSAVYGPATIEQYTALYAEYAANLES